MTATENEIDHAKEATQRERSLRTLADNEEWLSEHRDRTVRAALPVPQPDPIDRPPKVTALADAGQSRK